MGMGQCGAGGSEGDKYADRMIPVRGVICIQNSNGEIPAFMREELQENADPSEVIPVYPSLTAVIVREFPPVASLSDFFRGSSHNRH